MRKISGARLLGTLLAATVIMDVSAFAAAQQVPASTGQSDPVGAPASYITLRNDNLALSFVNGDNNVLNTYQGGLKSPDSLFAQPLTSNKVPTAGTNNSVSVSGRILSQDKDQLVLVGRSGSVPNAIKVRFAASGDFGLPNLHSRIPDVPDQISVAAGDLDKIPDVNGANHDELVVAYAGQKGNVNVAVLNYTAPQPNGSNPKYVTQAVAPFTVNLNSPPAPFPINGDQQGFKVSEVLAVAIGDFDGDGQNEIALATFDPTNHDSVHLVTFRYVHPTLSATPALKVVTQTTITPLGITNADLLPTISLAAGNFDGTGRAQLVLALRDIEWEDFPPQWNLSTLIAGYGFDSNLNPIFRGDFPPNGAGFEHIDGQPALDTLTPGRILCLPGLVNYDPSNGINLYRRGVVVLYNSIPAGGDGGFLHVDTYTANPDPNNSKFLDWTQLGDTITLPNQASGTSFAATLGAFGVNGDINNPQWSLAVAQLQGQGQECAPNQETVSVFQNIAGQGFGTDPITQTSIDSRCASGGCACDSDVQNELRPAIQAYDYQGQTILLGAPVKLTVPKLITTDFVLQDPPEHAYWNEAAHNLVVVSRNAGTNVSLTNKQGITYSGKSTDTTASSVGGSVSETASLGVKANVLGLFQTKFSVEETAKATYNYDQNQASYNSIYKSRTLTSTGKTDTDDFISGRFQKLTIWRYRVLGETTQNSAGKPVNLYYDVVIPGPALAFSGGGRSFDWYQPIQEPGNILSYPAPSDSTFNPPDLGTFQVCPTGATDCKPGDTNQMTGPMIGNVEQFLGGASQSIAYDYVDTNGQGVSVGYQKKLGTSLDVKAGFSTSVGFFGGGDASFSESLNLNSSNSWGNTTTSDSTSSSETGITINIAGMDSTRGYSIFPTLYTTLDGTIKMAFAADPLGNADGRSFWASLYGALPDPALNLPSRFSQNGTTWVVNDQSSRKRMRGFFVLSKDPDPVTGQYNILGQAPVVGDKVRLSAQVYNYSTGQPFKDCLVQFYAIKYDSNSDREQGKRQLIGKTTISLAPRETRPAQVVWDTSGFGPGGGGAGQDYRIYVVLNGDRKIKEIYPPEDLSKGIDPGQNDEGFGLATIVGRALGAKKNSPAATFSSTPLAWLPTGRMAASLATNDLAIGAGTPVRLRAQVCATTDSRDPVDVVLFDGEPSGGKVISWKRIHVPGNGQCESAWFDWTATRGNHNLVAAIDPTGEPATMPNNAGATTESSLNRASLQAHVP